MHAIKATTWYIFNIYILPKAESFISGKIIITTSYPLQNIFSLDQSLWYIQAQLRASCKYDKGKKYLQTRESIFLPEN